MIAVLKVVALVVVVDGGWAVLATLFTPPLTSGWREVIPKSNTSALRTARSPQS